MKAKKKNEKKVNSKSLEKRSTSRKNDMKLFLDCDLDYCDKSKTFVAETLDPKHR